MNVRKAYLLTILFGALVTAGCGGLTITKGGGNLPQEGYPVYLPMVVVNVTSKPACRVPAAAGQCPSAKVFQKCEVGAPYLLPDYSQQYVVEFEKGLGSYSGAMVIEDGWRLGGATSTADPSAFITAVAALSTLDADADDRDCKEGMYKLNRNNQFERLVVPFFGN